MGIVLIVIGIIWIIGSLVTKPNNLAAAFLFKVIPFITAAIVTIIGFYYSGIITISI
jgi:hypothetical protein